MSLPALGQKTPKNYLNRRRKKTTGEGLSESKCQQLTEAGAAAAGDANAGTYFLQRKDV